MYKLTMILLMMATACCANAQFIGTDPTQPPEASNNKLNDDKNVFLPSLEAIFVTSSGRRAIINGSVYLEAQDKNGLKVHRISADTVDVEYFRNGKVERITLSLGNASVVSRTTVENK